MEIQPAYKSYFFDQGFKDFKNVIRDNWSKNMSDSKDNFAKMEVSESVEKIFHFFSAISIIIFGTAMFSVISLLHITFLGIIFSSIYLSFTFIWSIDYLYRKLNKIFTVCPDCYHKSELPNYHCPKCKKVHSQLWPSSYGVLKRKCLCGEKLPTSFLNGRSKLVATCSNSECTSLIQTGETRPIIIPVIGGPSVGKTQFVASLLHELKENHFNTSGSNFEFIDKKTSEYYNNQIDILNRDDILAKTSEYNPQAINFFATTRNKKALYYIFDSAGEAFFSSDNLVQHGFYDYFDGLILIIDPFSIKSIYSKYEWDLKSNPNIKPSTYPIEEIYENFLLNLQKNYGIRVDEKIKKPLLILLSKTDFSSLNKNFTPDKLEVNSAKGQILSKADALDLRTRAFLMENDLDWLIRKIDWQFSKSKFLPIASKGKDSKGINVAVEWFFDALI